MILIGEPAAFEGDGVESSVLIAEDSKFYQPGKGVPAWIGMEYMAQTIALFAGVEAREAGRDIRIGLLLGTRRYSAFVPYFKLATMLKVRGEKVWQDDQMAVFACTIEAGERLAEAQLNVYLVRENEKVLKEKLE